MFFISCLLHQHLFSLCVLCVLWAKIENTHFLTEKWVISNLGLGGKQILDLCSLWTHYLVREKMDHCCNNIRIVICHHFENMQLSELVSTSITCRGKVILLGKYFSVMEGFFLFQAGNISAGIEKETSCLFSITITYFVLFKYKIRNVKHFLIHCFIRCATI